MLRGEFKHGDLVIVDHVEGEGLQFRREEGAPAPLPVEQPAPLSQ
jgi:hypothetical protein